MLHMNVFEKCGDVLSNHLAKLSVPKIVSTSLELSQATM